MQQKGDAHCWWGYGVVTNLWSMQYTWKVGNSRSKTGIEWSISLLVIYFNTWDERNRFWAIRKTQNCCRRQVLRLSRDSDRWPWNMKKYALFLWALSTTHRDKFHSKMRVLHAIDYRVLLECCDMTYVLDFPLSPNNSQKYVCDVLPEKFIATLFNQSTTWKYNIVLRRVFNNYSIHINMWCEKSLKKACSRSTQ